MGGRFDSQPMFTVYINLGRRVLQDHLLRKIKFMADQELKRLSLLFHGMYWHTGRTSISSEREPKSLLLIALYSVRGEPKFYEQLGYDPLFRWCLDMGLNDDCFNPTVFTKNRERLMVLAVGRRFFDAVVGQVRGFGWMSDEHFTVDGTLIFAWSSLKRGLTSFRFA